MSAPTADPIIVQILNAIASALLNTITTDNGFYSDIAGAGIEPLAFNQQDTYPQLVVHEQSSSISDSNEDGYQDSVVVEVHGFLESGSATAYASAFKLRDDITRVLRSITAETFKLGAAPAIGYLNANRSLVSKWSVNEQRSVVESELAAGFVEVIVRASFDYRDFSRPVPGI